MSTCFETVVWVHATKGHSGCSAVPHVSMPRAHDVFRQEMAELHLEQQATRLA